MTSKQWPLFVREHAPLVWQTVYRLLANHADATDCFQETFVSAWQMADARDGRAVKNWPGLLQHVATARALDHLRRRKRRAKHFAPRQDFGEIPSADNGPVALAESAELSAQLRSALAELPEKQSQAYCLRHLNGLSYEQIAETLGMTVSNVGVSLSRAAERLRAILTPILTEERNSR